VKKGAAFRGQPLLMLAALLVGWLALRVALWQPPFEAPRAALQSAAEISPTIRAPAVEAGPITPKPQVARAQAAGLDLPGPVEPLIAPPLDPIPTSPLEGFGPVPVTPAPGPSEPAPRAVIGHNLLLLAGLSQMEVPPALLAYLQGARAPVPRIPAAAPMVAAVQPAATVAAASRWTADAWLLLRDDTVSPLLSGRPSYGRSQAGGVVRYRLAADSPLRPQAYLRASSALAGAREQEVAAGLSARPLPAVPVRLAVEARVGETDRGMRVRPAAYAVTEFPPLALPLGMRAEAYAQGGYVGGDYATAFVDGQARLERPLMRRGGAELSAGAGVWGGAQRDAARLDIGPTAAVSFRLGDARGRVAADYRFRVAGDAEPASGPALTLSAGF
jgi:hypothetical protein